MRISRRDALAVALTLLAVAMGPAEAFEFEYAATKNNPDMIFADRFLAACAKNMTPFCLFQCSNEPHSPWNKGDASRYDPAKLTLPPYFVDTKETRRNLSNYLAEITYYDSQVGESLALLELHARDCLPECLYQVFHIHVLAEKISGRSPSSGAGPSLRAPSWGGIVPYQWRSL